MDKMITCPTLGCFAKLGYEENPETGRILGATKCSLIDGEVDCEQECIRLLNIRRESESEAPA